MGWLGQDDEDIIPLPLIKVALGATSVTVGTTTTYLPTTPLAGRTIIDIYNNSTTTEILLFGLRPIEPKASLRLQVTDNVGIWATVSAGSAEAIVMEGR